MSRIFTDTIANTLLILMHIIIMSIHVKQNFLKNSLPLIKIKK